MTGATQEVTTAVVRVAFAVARDKLAGRSYTTSVLVLVSALVKLRTVSDLPPNRKVRACWPLACHGLCQLDWLFSIYLCVMSASCL